jgi:hypothetical protein
MPGPRFGAVFQGSSRNPNIFLIGDQLHESACPVYNPPIAQVIVNYCRRRGV